MLAAIADVYELDDPAPALAAALADLRRALLGAREGRRAAVDLREAMQALLTCHEHRGGGGAADAAWTAFACAAAAALMDEGLEVTPRTLARAVDTGDPELVRALVARGGVGVNALHDTRTGRAPVWFAAPTPAMLRSLVLEHGADPAARSDAEVDGLGAPFVVHAAMALRGSERADRLRALVAAAAELGVDVCARTAVDDLPALVFAWTPDDVAALVDAGAAEERPDEVAALVGAWRVRLPFPTQTDKLEAMAACLLRGQAWRRRRALLLAVRGRCAPADGGE